MRQPFGRILFMSGHADTKLLSRGVTALTMKILHKPFTAPGSLLEWLR